LLTKKKKTWKNKECLFTYRDSVFKQELKNKVIITAVTFVLEKPSDEYTPNIQYNDIQNSI
jgi:UDP-N-acetylmuramate dehydrogenase